MMWRLRRCLFGAVVVGALGALAGCGGHYLFAEREPWRHEAELQCMNSGAVREGSGKVRISPIDGPGVCGADFPLKVSSLGDGVPLSFDEELRPPAAVPNRGTLAPPRWPIVQPHPTSSAVMRDDLPPPAAGAGSRLMSDQPLSLDPSGARERMGASPEAYDFRRPFEAARPPPALGSASAPVTGSIGPVAVSPAATLACPLVSVLDRWIDESVQPAAVKWFGVPVVEIKQISAYSCRGMNGDPNATISEHAFGNALDIAAFTLADGRKIDLQHGWHGAPEEQAFLHDVQATACDQFTTVLAPGSNAFHYNHIHVDLMRRSNGRHACNPQPITGDEMAARLGGHVAARRSDPVVTGSVSQRRAAASPQRLRSSAYSDHRSNRDLPDAVAGADGED